MKKLFDIHRQSSGYSLMELVITLGVLAILVMGTIPMAQNAAKRDKELKLRETLRMVRAAIDEFKRDTYGACAQGAVNTQNPTAPGAGGAPVDPRSRVVIDDCKIFETDNADSDNWDEINVFDIRSASDEEALNGEKYSDW